MFILSGVHRPRDLAIEYDQYAGNVVSLLRGDNDYTDEAGNTWVTVTGTPTIVNTVGNPADPQGKAMYFNGASSIGTAHKAKFNMQGQNATIEFWAYIPNAGGLPGHQIIYKSGWEFAQGQSGYFAYFVEGGAPRGNSSSGWRIQAYNGQMNLQFLGSGDNTTPSISNATWTHFEFVLTPADLTKLRVFRDGVLVASGGNPLSSVDQAISMIMGGPSRNDKYLTGYIYGFRFTVGAARHTANFTPPTVLPTLA